MDAKILNIESINLVKVIEMNRSYEDVCTDTTIAPNVSCQMALCAVYVQDIV